MTIDKVERARESAWLLESGEAGFPMWAYLRKPDYREAGWKATDAKQPIMWVQMTRDANEALGFASKADAEQFLALLTVGERNIGWLIPTEHMFTGPASEPHISERRRDELSVVRKMLLDEHDPLLDVLDYIEAALEPLAERRVAATIPGVEGLCHDCGRTREQHDNLETRHPLCDMFVTSLNVSEVLEALEPFAELCDNFVGEEEDDQDLYKPPLYEHQMHVRVGDLRRAAKALTALKSPPSPGREGLPDDVRKLVIAAREFWDDNEDTSLESCALDRALEAFSDCVPYAETPLTPSNITGKDEG